MVTLSNLIQNKTVWQISRGQGRWVRFFYLGHECRLALWVHEIVRYVRLVGHETLAGFVVLLRNLTLEFDVQRSHENVVLLDVLVPVDLGASDFIDLRKIF